MIYNNTHSDKRSMLAHEALYKVGLAGREKHYPSKLSCGQRQRVAIARTIVNDPSIVLEDESTGNLESQTSSEIRDKLKTLNEQRKTIIIITHENDLRKKQRESPFSMTAVFSMKTSKKTATEGNQK